jgi:hypothetical protein
MNKTIIAYAVGLYTAAICFGLYLNTAHGAETNRAGQGETLSCRQYLEICEASCANRDGMFRFLCLGPDFNPSMERYRCQCGDEAFKQQSVKAEPVKVGQGK